MADDKIKRVQLRDGQWADVKLRTTVGDIRRQQKHIEERGHPDSMLDAFVVWIEKWSLGDTVTDDLISALDVDDAAEISTVARAGRDDDNPNSSSTSPNGTQRKKAKSATTVETRRGNE